MSRTLPIPPPGFDDLSAEEQVDYVQSLWERILVHPEDLPVPEWHWRVLDERLASYKANPGAARPWEEVREEINQKLKDHRSRRA